MTVQMFEEKINEYVPIVKQVKELSLSVGVGNVERKLIHRASLPPQVTQSASIPKDSWEIKLLTASVSEAGPAAKGSLYVNRSQAGRQSSVTLHCKDDWDCRG